MTVETAPYSERLTAPDADTLSGLGEYFAAGFYRRPSESMVERFARGLREWAEGMDVPPDSGDVLYPTGPAIMNGGDMAVGWFYVGAMSLNRDVLDAKVLRATEAEREELTRLEESWTSHQFPGGYTHSIPNYERVLGEGLNGFAQRVEDGLARSVLPGDETAAGFYRAMETTLGTARELHSRFVRELESSSADGEASRRNREALLDAYSRVPFEPATTFFEAAVCVNFIFYLDGCDNLGRFDQYMWPFYRDDVESGKLERSEAVALVRRQWRNVDESYGWNVAIGGTNVAGDDLSNDFTVVCIQAARGMRRPNLALRLGESTPDEVWDAAFDTILTGCGLPALYWDPNYFRAIDASDVPLPDDEKSEFAFGGCTELMVQGKSFVGSLDGDVNLPKILADTVQEALAGAESFGAFRREYFAAVEAAIEELTQLINGWQESKASHQPQPIRSLLVDDCVDDGREYSAGGARYNWSVINVMGLANAVDSLAAIEAVVFDSGDASPAELAEVLAHNFDGHEPLLRRLEAAPRFGNGDERADAIAAELSGHVFGELLRRKTWRGGPFVPSCLMFTTYAWFGKPVGATADGRFAGEPIADSAGPYQGRDVSGPTAMLRSVAEIDQQHAPGTLVVNIRLGREHFADDRQRGKLKALIRSYFDMGGLQLQANVIDQKTLEDAVEHPERYGDLVVRVGGYSEYWRNLDTDLRESILLRTEH